jgi:hypothetical protein
MSILQSFFPSEKLFATFFFFHHKFHIILHWKQEEKIRKKIFVPGEKGLSKKNFFPLPIFIAVFFGGEQFLLNFFC